MQVIAAQTAFVDLLTVADGLRVAPEAAPDEISLCHDATFLDASLRNSSFRSAAR